MSKRHNRFNNPGKLRSRSIVRTERVTNVKRYRTRSVLRSAGSASLLTVIDRRVS